MQCPLCDHQASRGEVHAHLADSHQETVEMWTDARTGKMRYRVACPQCEQSHEASVKPRSHDTEFLTVFAHEIRLVAFDMLLNHLEAEHDALPPGEPAPAYASLPAAGPGGGRGRPGARGVPLPPGMGEPDLPPWMEAAARLKVTHVDEPRREK